MTQTTKGRLSVSDHRRDSAGLRYVYPVVSRRAGGVSIGINLNPNNACNWRCVYCQVPDLKRGAAPVVDFVWLETELRQFLEEAIHGGFMRERVPPQAHRINDIALSGNGEPTTAREFDRVIALIGKVRKEFKAMDSAKLVLITNGSLVGRPAVREGLRLMADLNGEVWFKLDSATTWGMQRINHTRIPPARARENLLTAAALCPTWIQTCVFQMDGVPPAPEERRAYLAFLADARRQGAPLQGVLLYGLARPSLQAEAPRLAPVPEAWVRKLAEEIEALGLDVKVNP